QPPPYGYPPPYGQPPPYGAPPPYGYPPYGQGGWGGYPAPPPTNGLAVASMVLGIVWIYWIGSILALIFGYVARSQIRHRGQNGDGMAIAGIVLGWVGIVTLVFVVIVALGTNSP
ncbi:MAG: DUF4190 domain-containing protein, partial [Frankiaceae bacterium]|nr:DUF4190 domain-containing protein [Frankiaceae bacterium]MBV9369942.1 DUF4190 domain-containing protein [Frankiales bacterium]